MPNLPRHPRASCQRPEITYKDGPHPLHFAPRATGDTPTPALAGTWVDVEDHWEARHGMQQPLRYLHAMFSRSPGQSLRSPLPGVTRCAQGPPLSNNTAMYHRNILIEQTDPELFAAIQAENARQEHHIELIASENYASPAVMAAQGTQLTNKYAEGYPGKRYYGGCEFVDIAEQLAIDRVKQLFGADAANVQPHCGASANEAVFLAFLKPGDTIMGMSLAEGGHLTHGMPLNMSGKWFNVVSYGLDANEAIDYDAMERKAHETKPKLIIAGASAYSLRIDFERFAEVAKDVGAIFMVDMAHYAGLVAAGVYPNPVPFADVVTSTTHKSLRGPRGGIILMKAQHEKAINSAIFPGLQGGPLMHVIAAKAVAFKEALAPEFKTYQQQVVKNAQIVADTLTQRGLRIISGRTESHVMLVDLRAKGITGKEAEAVLGSAHMTINKNAIPNDPEKPMVTSGVRIGTPAMTTRGFKDEEARITANLVADVLDNPRDPANIDAVRAKVNALTARFPVYS
jgi:glycine hydroxymethyltransferase